MHSGHFYLTLDTLRQASCRLFLGIIKFTLIFLGMGWEVILTIQVSINKQAQYYNILLFTGIWKKEKKNNKKTPRVVDNTIMMNILWVGF